MAGGTSDYDSAPERYRLGMAVTRRHSSASLYAEVAARLAVLGARRVLDVGCAEGVLRSVVSPGPLVVGLDTAAALLRAHPPPVVRRTPPTCRSPTPPSTRSPRSPCSTT